MATIPKSEKRRERTKRASARGQEKMRIAIEQGSANARPGVARALHGGRDWLAQAFGCEVPASHFKASASMTHSSNAHVDAEDWPLFAEKSDRLEALLAHARSFLFGSSIVLVYALIFTPVLILVLISFFSNEIVSFPPEDFTVRWYANAWSKPDFSQGFVYSLEIAAVSTLIGVPIGTAAAMAIVRGGLWFKEAISQILLGPLAVPGVVLGAALYMCLIRLENELDRDLVGGLATLIAAHVLLTIPWTVRLIQASLEGLDRAPEEAAASLGARPWSVFCRVTLPALRPGIVAASLFSFISSFENLEISLLLVGPSQTTLPVAMLSYLEYRMDPTLAAVATIQVVIIVGLMLITDRFVKLSRVI